MMLIMLLLITLIVHSCVQLFKLLIYLLFSDHNDTIINKNTQFHTLNQNLIWSLLFIRARTNELGKIGQLEVLEDPIKQTDFKGRCHNHNHKSKS